MNYIGKDIHKKCRVACVQDERDQIVRSERIEGNRVEGFRLCLQGERARAVIEASYNWTKIYEGGKGVSPIIYMLPRIRLHTLFPPPSGNDC